MIGVRRVAIPPLYAIVDPLRTGRAPADLAAALLAGGARLLQLRLKDAAARDLLAAADAIRALTRRYGALFLVNDRPDVALAVGADGVHLGQDDLPVAHARRILGPERYIGVSTHDEGEARSAVAAGADYIGFGPICATTSKADALPARGLARLRALRPLVPCPIVAIGGITADTATTVRTAGADAVAMIAALVEAPDVVAATRDVVTRLGR
ncbi:MAG: thiamine phosphate synthase [Candidatus Binatia bacterium]